MGLRLGSSSSALSRRFVLIETAGENHPRKGWGSKRKLGCFCNTQGISTSHQVLTWKDSGIIFGLLILSEYAPMW